MSEALQPLTDSTFESFTAGEGLCLVDFSAAWCAPCRTLSKILEKIAPEYRGRLRMGGVNADDYPGIAGKYGIMSLPSVLIFKNGGLEAKLSGMISEAALREKLDGLA